MVSGILLRMDQWMVAVYVYVLGDVTGLRVWFVGSRSQIKRDVKKIHTFLVCFNGYL